MQNHFARALQNQQQVNHFLYSVLNIDAAHYKSRIEYEIMTAEKGIVDGLIDPTLTSAEYRDMRYRTEKQRLTLRNRIVEELFTLEQLANDDEIALGVGGAKPGATQTTRDASIIIGLPASGKSSVATKIANHQGAYILDADFAKRKLPEYDGFPWGASIVHAESQNIIFGPDSKTFQSLFAKVVETGQNLIIPTIGGKPDDVVELREIVTQRGYKAHLTLVHLSKVKATLRALKRFNDTRKYVPLSRIFDVYSENAALTYFLLRTKAKGLFASFGVVNTDVPRDDMPICTDLIGKNPAVLYPRDTNCLI